MVVRSSDGTLIFCESFFATRARGALLIVHGLGEHSGRYSEVIDQAMSLHFDVHVMDLRGHGRSQGTRGHFRSIEELHADLDAWITHLVSSKVLSDRLPCLLLGHSLGGLVALTFAAAYVPKPLAPAIDGLILSNPLLGVRFTPRRQLEAQLAARVPAFLDSIQMPNGIDPEDLSHDKGEVERYLDDPLVHQWLSPAGYNAILKAIAGLGKLYPAVSMPTLFMLSGKDKVVDTDSAESFAKKLSVGHPGKVEVKIFHSFFHEPFHELRRKQAFLELKKWILKCTNNPQRRPAKRTSLKSSARGATGKGTSH